MLSLQLGGAASFGTFVPATARTYTAAASATVTSTAGDATLSVSDPEGTALTNGAFSLAQPVRVNGVTRRGAEDLERADDRRAGDAELRAGDRCERCAALGRVHQDAGLHALDGDALTDAFEARFGRALLQALEAVRLDRARARPRLDGCCAAQARKPRVNA